MADRRPHPGWELRPFLNVRYGFSHFGRWNMPGARPESAQSLFSDRVDRGNEASSPGKLFSPRLKNVSESAGTGFFTARSAMTPADAAFHRYRIERTNEAFREVVTVHLPMVYGTALRLGGGNCADAEDVSQMVFADLARKAPELREDVSA